MGPRWLQRLLEPIAKRGIASYRKTGGTNRMATMMGFPVVLLTTKGAKSGEERTVSIGGFADGDDAWLVVASKGGSATHPAWFNNMVKHPDEIWLEVGSRKMKVRGDSLQGREREDALARIAAISARYGKYPTKTDREIPVVRLTRISG
ncbi:MAG TPA: nitroreductase/quinone reductase family protein [Candidatus Dormibacteraeota bacterium]